MNSYRSWGPKKSRERIQASLSDFSERQKARADERQRFQRWYWKQVLPQRRIERRPLDPKRDIYPAQRSPETHVEIRRAAPQHVLIPGLGIPDWPITLKRERVLELAFSRRACFICSEFGDCKHREHSLELVIAQFVGIGGELE